MMSFSFGNVLFWGSAIVAFAMLRKIWLSEKARRSIERERDEHFASEREFSRARQRERGDGT
jgi:hypothetical protein